MSAQVESVQTALNRFHNVTNTQIAITGQIDQAMFDLAMTVIRYIGERNPYFADWYNANRDAFDSIQAFAARGNDSTFLTDLYTVVNTSADIEGLDPQVEVIDITEHPDREMLEPPPAPFVTQGFPWWAIFLGVVVVAGIYFASQEN